MTAGLSAGDIGSEDRGSEDRGSEDCFDCIVCFSVVSANSCKHSKEK